MYSSYSSNNLYSTSTVSSHNHIRSGAKHYFPQYQTYSRTPGFMMKSGTQFQKITSSPKNKLKTSQVSTSTYRQNPFYKNYLLQTNQRNYAYSPQNIVSQFTSQNFNKQNKINGSNYKSDLYNTSSYYSNLANHEIPEYKNYYKQDKPQNSSYSPNIARKQRYSPINTKSRYNDNQIRRIRSEQTQIQKLNEINQPKQQNNFYTNYASPSFNTRLGLMKRQSIQTAKWINTNNQPYQQNNYNCSYKNNLEQASDTFIFQGKKFYKHQITNMD